MKQIKDKKFIYHHKKDSKLLMTQDCFRHSIKIEYQKIINLLDTSSNNVPRFNTQKWIEVHDQSRKIYNTNKQGRFKTSML